MLVIGNNGGVGITCNCENRDERIWDRDDAPDKHPDWTNITCTGCRAEWQYHNIGIGRTVIVADWEKTGWRLFVFPAVRIDYEQYIDQILGEQLREIGLDDEVVGHIVGLSATNLNRFFWESDSGFTAPRGTNIEWANPNGGEIHARLHGGYYLNDLPREFFLENDFFAGGLCDLIIENAHFRRRTETSLSQVYDRDELVKLHARTCENLRIFEFPNRLSKRARIEAGIETPGMTPNQIVIAKERDPEALLDFTQRRRGILFRRFSPTPKVELEDDLSAIAQAQNIEEVAQLMHDTAEAVEPPNFPLIGLGVQWWRRRAVRKTVNRLRDEFKKIRSTLSPQSKIMESILKIRDDYNSRLNALRFFHYDMSNAPESTPFFESLSEQIDDALAILDRRFGRNGLSMGPFQQPDFSENDIADCINGGISELQILPEESDLLDDYRKLKSASWPENFTQPSDEELKAQWAMEYHLLRTIINLNQDRDRVLKAELQEAIDAHDDIVVPRKNAEWFRTFLIDNGVPPEDLVNDQDRILSVLRYREICRELGLRDSINYSNAELFGLIPTEHRNPDWYIENGTIYKNTGGVARSGSNAIEMNAIMSLYCCVFDNNRMLRRRGDTGDFIGVDFVWSRLLLMTPYNGGVSGVPRANLMWYVFKERFSAAGPTHANMNTEESPSYIGRQSNRRDFRRAIKALIRIFRDAGLAREAVDGNG